MKSYIVIFLTIIAGLPSLAQKPNYFTAEPTTLLEGDTCTINWKTVNNRKVYLLPFGPVNTTGQLKKTFKETTVLILITSDDGGFIPIL